MLFKKGLWTGLAYVFVLLLILSILLSSILEANKATIDQALGTQSTQLVSEDGDGLYTKFQPRDEFVNKDSSGKITGYNTKAYLKEGIQLARRTGYEGSVLLKNNGALPLATGSNVTLLGKRSHTPLLGSSQGVVAVGQIITLERALGGTATNFAEDKVSGDYSNLDNFQFSELSIDGLSSGAGAGYHLNQDMIARYTELIASSEFTAGYNDHPRNASTDVQANNNVIKEPNASRISDVSLNGYKDAAIVVLGRPSSESADFTTAKTTEGKSVLALTDDELSIVDYATTNFDKVIVLINTNSPMEIKELEKNDKVDAILWVGHPGDYGMLGVADVLCGRVSPSGGLADIYATDTMSAPAMMNFGAYSYANGATDVTRNSNSRTYVIEAESIYTGYRYYETRYNDTIYGKGNASSTAGVGASTGNWKYADEVVYSFGYGLSYTNFDFEIQGNPTYDKTAHTMYTTFNVKVTNKGSVAGATPVQIYGQAPYEHGKTKVEKPSVQLMDFGKTKILAPNESETVTVTVDWQNIASYDSSYKNADGTEGSYILDNGDYYFAVGNGAHDALNNILALQGKTTSDGMDYNGKASYARKVSYSYGGSGVDGNTFGYSKSNTKIQNQIPYADWNYYTGAQKVTYLSRSDWSGTWPVTYDNMTAPASMLDWLNGLYYTPKTGEDTSAYKWGDSSVELNFYDLALMDYDDPRWEDILSKMTLEDAITMAAFGGNTFAAAESVGFAGGKLTENTGNGIQTYTPSNNLLDDNCPWKVTTEDKNHNIASMIFGSAPFVVSSFNHDLIYEVGAFIGEEAILIGLPIIWGPGGNTHRHAYNGRSGEYASEDPVLAGAYMMDLAIGARDHGLIMSPKHYAFNDQETNRNGIAPYLTEQRAREIELRAFQVPFEADNYNRARRAELNDPTYKTGMLGMMTSFSKIGAVECTSSWGLLNGIAVGEWDFHGYIVTDINDDFDLFDAMLVAGCTGYDNRTISNPSWARLTGSQGNMYVQPATSPVEARQRPTLEHYQGDATLMEALKNSVHRTLYVFTQSVLMNQYNSSTRLVDLMTWWRATYIAAIVVFSVLTAGAAAMYVVSYLKKKEDN